MNNSTTEYNPVVSVVIPLYNKRPFVRRAIKSVQQQGFTNWELIIVDDGSTDGSADEVPCSDRRIQLFRQENKGPGAARNAGLARATGKYVAFLDADDEWLPSFLEAGLSLLEDGSLNINFVCTGFYFYPDMRKHIFSIEGEQPGVFEINAETDVSLVQQLFSSIITCGYIVRTDVVRKWGGFFDRYKCLYGEDVYLLYKLLFNERIGIIPEPLGIYHTDASELFGGGRPIKKFFPIMPYLEYPEEILASCPPEKLHILKEELALRALQRAKYLSKLGRGMEATDLLNRFNQDGYPSPKEVSKVRLFARISPFLPALGWLWRSTKSMASFGRVMQ